MPLTIILREEDLRLEQTICTKMDTKKEKTKSGIKYMCTYLKEKKSFPEEQQLFIYIASKIFQKESFLFRI